MSTRKKLAVAAVLLIGSASLAIAQHDGDANPIPGARQRGVMIAQAPYTLGNAFAATRPAVRAPRRRLDGDGNPVLGRR
jgi:hypothetical protein